MNSDEKRDVYTLLEYMEVNTYLDSADSCLLEACCAIEDDDLEMDLEILERMTEYIEHLQIKIGKKTEALLKKNKMDAEGLME